MLTDRDANRRKIVETFGQLRRTLKCEDILLVFLAVHGMIDRVGNKDEKYFVPSDADWRDMFGTAIAMNEFRRMLDVEAERVLVIADACYSGDIKLWGGAEEVFKPLSGKGRILIGYDGPAREDKKLGSGYLTYYLLEGLSQ